MSKMGLDWYKREPQAYLGGVQGMTAREHAVYAVTLDLIYVNGGSINNDAKWIAGWISDMGQAAVRKTIEALTARGKLVIDGGLLTQERAKREVKTKENLREKSAKNGKKGGENSAKTQQKLRKNSEKTNGKPTENREKFTENCGKITIETNRNSHLSEASALNETQADKIREEKKEKKIKKEDDFFDEFWSVYPKKAGKAAARKAWDKAIKETAPSEIIEGAKQYSIWLKSAKDGEFRPIPKHPQGWINDARWCDEEIWIDHQPCEQKLSYAQQLLREHGRAH